MAERQRGHEERLPRRKNCKENTGFSSVHMAPWKMLCCLLLLLFICLVFSFHTDKIMSLSPAQERRGNQETQTDQSHEQRHQTERAESEQKKESQQTEETGSEQQGGGGQGDEEKDEEDESDQEDEESDSEEETEDGKNKQAARKKKTKRHRKKVIQNTPETECQESCNDQKQKSESCIDEENKYPDISLGLLNAWSMNKKTSKILELIKRNNLDVFLITETWLRLCSAAQVLREASPPNYTQYHQSRDGRGGGVSGQFSPVLQAEVIHFDNITTFEFVITAVKHDKWDVPVLIITVYRPPKGSFAAFLGQFQRFLDGFKNYSSIILAGDFNIWVDRNMSRTQTFHAVLGNYSLEQHVKEPTHRKQHTLDLVITRNVEISRLFVRNDTISDHCTVYFHARPVERSKENTDQDEQTKRIKEKEE